MASDATGPLILKRILGHAQELRPSHFLELREARLDRTIAITRASACRRQLGAGCFLIEVHLLRYALAAAETGSFSRAADQFRVKQSTLSKRIRHLELRIGLPLFTRTTQGVALTAMGTQFLARARVIVGELEQLSFETGAMARGELGTLKIGFHGSLACGGLRAVVDDFRVACPDVAVEATEGEREQLLDGVVHDRLDCALVAGAPAVERCCSLYLWSEPLIVGLAAGDLLLERDTLYWTDLRGRTFLVTRTDPGNLISAIIASRLTGPGHVPKVVAQAVSRENLPALVTGSGVTVTAGAMSTAGGGLVFREVHDAFGATRLDHNLHWRGANANPALAKFLKLVERRFGRSVQESERPPRGGGA